MNSRNRYASNPTYGANKRMPPKKRDMMPDGPAMPHQAPYPMPNPNAPYQAPYPGQNPNAPYQAPYPGQNPNGPYPYRPTGQPAGPFANPAPGAVPTAPNAPYGYQAPGAAQPMQQGAAMPQMMPPASPYGIPPGQNYTVLPPQEAYEAVPRANDTWVKLLVLAVLPVLFIITLLMPDLAMLKWSFIVLSVIGLVGTWFFSTFASSAKTTLSLVYVSLVLMTVVTLLASPPGDPNARAASGGGGLGAITTTPPPTTNPAAGDLGTFVEGEAQVPTPEPPLTSSEAAKQLQSFFTLWAANQTPEMLKLCAPSWLSSLTKTPSTELFSILINRIPSELVIEQITGTDADSSRTITATALIDKRNNTEPARYRFKIMMLKENGTWYVDPKTLASNEPLTTPANQGVAGDPLAEEGLSADQIATGPTPTPPPTEKTQLYRNAKGGKRYHIDSHCKSVDDSYFPLEPFYYGDVSNSKYKALTPCTVCNAPARPK